MTTNLKYRDMLLTGKLFMPTIEKIKTVYGVKIYTQIENMFEAMWFHYLKNGEDGTISLPYWAERIKNPKAMNIALRLLSKNGWITSVSLSENNWGEARLNKSKLLEFVTKSELGQIRKDYKFTKYVLKLEDESTKSNRTRLNGEVQNTGLIRNGFMKTGNTVFEFDTNSLFKYKDESISLINKGIEKMIANYPTIRDDLANYEEVGKEVIENYIYANSQYSAGQNTNDSRGRNISGMLNKIGNPIGFKIMRSMLVIPEANRNIATAKGLRNKYLFIAELLGYKQGNVQGKVNFGRRSYFNKTLIENIKLDDLYENVWLERMYNELDIVLDTSSWKKKIFITRYHANEISMTKLAKHIETFELQRKWYVPIEIDVSASILAIMGLLLNHKPFMERTNMIGSTIGDAWKHDVIVNRIQFKTIMRVCYGSSLPADQMWKDMDIKYTTEEVLAFEQELETGELAVANKFKDFIIVNVKPKEQMKLKIDNEEFDIECNKYFNLGETTNQFDFYDTYSNSIKRIHNTKTVKKPDLKSFRRFFVTAIIHNLDSQVEDNTVNAVMDAYQWAIDIHDAIILCCEATDYAKDVYCNGNNPEEPSLKRIHTNKNAILGKYFTSIGIGSTKLSEWKRDVQSHIEPFKGKFNCNRAILK